MGGVDRVHFVDEYMRPDIASALIYPAMARAIMFNLHENLLEMVVEGLSSAGQRPRTLVIVGPGSEVLPFSENLDTVVGNLCGGNIVLLDYNEAICDKIPAYLESKGFLKHFSVERVDGMIDPSGSVNRIFIKTCDIRDGLPLAAESVDCIDMTLSIHHVTQYRSDITDVMKRSLEVLKPGGFVHIGEGDVDMKYSERKIGCLVHDIVASGENGVMLVDSRYACASPREKMFGDAAGVEMHISGEGMVCISGADAKRLSSYLREKGYKQMYRADDRLVLPLIDHSMERDFNGMLVPVREYYRRVREICLPNLPVELHGRFLAALSKEESDAARGIVEYYSPPAMLCDALRKAGFRIEEMRYTAHGPFVNILARK